jgi:hypothetical protein
MAEHVPELAWSPESPAALPRNGHLWMTAASLVLLAYALMGKGAAYVGVPPLFVGEFLLVGGIVALIAFGRFQSVRMPAMLWWVTAFCVWGLARTVPYWSVYGIDALRDAVIWGYAAFAFIWFLYILSDIRRFVQVLLNYERFATLALVGMPLLFLVRFFLAENTPKWPWADATIIEPKPGDIMVHLAGIFAFWTTRSGKTVGLPWLCLFGLCAGVIGAYERAALFAFGAVFLLCAMFRPGHHALRGLAMLGVMGLGFLAITGIKLDVPVADSAKVREISFDQFASNILSTFGSSSLGDLDDTKEWRLSWWTEIINYTLRGDHFWAGKGFGVNLADDDGFQVMEDHSLRSPHNAHLMILARAGVPGVAIWLVVQFGWAGAIFSALQRSRRDGNKPWAGVFLFFLAYWLAFMINASFDVFLEGPMGGIWFWSLYGIGLAALWIWKHHPEVLEDYANPYRS